MNFNQIESFVKIAETGSFSRAAKELFVTQPTVSAHIQALEKAYGVKLFARTTKEVLLTEDGKKLYHYAKQIMVIQEKMDTLFQDKSYGDSNNLTIATSSIPAQVLLPQIMPKYGERYPNIHFQIQETDSGKVVDAIANHVVDIGFTGTVMEKRFCKYIPICKDNLVVIMPNTEKYRAIRDMEKSIEWILDEPIIVREAGSGTRRETEKQLIKADIDFEKLNIIAIIENVEAIKRSVKNGLGITIISRIVVEEEIEEGSLLEFPLSPRGGKRSLNLIYNNSYPLSRPAEKLVKLVKEEYGI